MDGAPRPPRAGERAFGLLLLAAALGLLAAAHAISGFEALSSPGAFPMAAAAAMTLAALVVVLADARRARRGAAPAAADEGPLLPWPVLVLGGATIAFAALLEPLGFLPSAFLFLLVAIGLLARRGWLFALAVAILSLALIYVLFRLVFQVVLPEGLVPEREIMAAIGRALSGGDAE